MFLGVWNYVDQIHGELNGVRVGDPPAPPASGFNLSTEYRETLYMAFPDAQHPYPRLMYQNAAHHPSQEVFTFEPTKVNGCFCVKWQNRFVACDEDGNISLSSQGQTPQTILMFESRPNGSFIIRSSFGHVLGRDDTGAVRGFPEPNDLSQCTTFLIANSPRPRLDGSEKLGGSWETNNNTLEMNIHFDVNVRRVAGHFTYQGRPARVEGFLWKGQDNCQWLEGNWQIVGENSPMPCCFQFPASYEKISGWSLMGDQVTNYTGRRDTYVCIASWKDYSEQWLNGQRMSTAVASDESLEGMLNQYLCPQVMDDKNRYRCGTCNEKRRAEQYVKIESAPSHLLITLKRFSYDFQTNTKSKIFREIDFPLTFRLPLTAASEPHPSEESKAERQGPLYGLYAVIFHSGASADVGHYYCYARESDVSNLAQESTSDGGWYRFDDHTVSPATFTELKKVTHKYPSDSAYILFYRQITRHADADRPANRPLADQLSSVRGGLNFDLCPAVPTLSAMDNRRFDAPELEKFYSTSYLTRLLSTMSVVNALPRVARPLSSGALARLSPPSLCADQPNMACPLPSLQVVTCGLCQKRYFLNQKQEHASQCLVAIKYKYDDIVARREAAKAAAGGGAPADPGMVCPMCGKSFKVESQYMRHISSCLEEGDGAGSEAEPEAPPPVARAASSDFQDPDTIDS
eukprot:TRINITY_DN824_c0_g1_i11.p1 TRINITY_DN824_c0_g1~~TRINITY_DN824_c0_g1_i11.p1  ORF type:complete len:688 (+),score=205.64 TRINITY_DN824_c0_g1_i11:598-2661(+)